MIWWTVLHIVWHTVLHPQRPPHLYMALPPSKCATNTCNVTTPALKLCKIFYGNHDNYWLINNTGLIFISKTTSSGICWYHFCVWHYHYYGYYEIMDMLLYHWHIERHHHISYITLSIFIIQYVQKCIIFISRKEVTIATENKCTIIGI